MPTEYNLTTNSEKLRAFRSAYFRHRISACDDLVGINTFHQGWLSQIWLTALSCNALEMGTTMEDACNAVFGGHAPLPLSDVLDVLFQSLSDNNDANQPRVRMDIANHLDDPSIRATLATESQVLWSAPDDQWQQWASRRFKATLGAALLEAGQRLCPEFDIRDLLLDIEPGPRPNHPPLPEGIEEIWLTETTLGGGGLLESLLSRYGEDPRYFFQLVESALQPSDFEILNEALTHIITWTNQESDFQDALQQLRAPATHEDLQQYLTHFRQRLTSRGLLLSHPVMVAINARILRPGSSVETDRLLAKLLTRWRDTEQQLGIEIDARVIAYLGSMDDTLDQALPAAVAGVTHLRQWRFSNLYGLLWARGGTVRENALSVYNPYTDLPPADRFLVLDCLPSPTRCVSIETLQWRASIIEQLQQAGQVQLSAPLAQTLALKSAIATLLADPVDMGPVLLPIIVSGVQRGDGELMVNLELSEVLQ
jgi:hypothetical protein